MVPGRGDKVDYGIGLSYRPSGYIGWRAGTTTLCYSRLCPPVRYYEFGYYSFVEQQQPQNLSLAFLLLTLGLSQRAVFAWHNQVYPSSSTDRVIV
jgi:hypothetical protein